jgi:hypothetical protein
MGFEERYLRTPGSLELAGRRIKLYHVNHVDTEIEPEVQEAAYAFLPKLLAEPDGTPPLAFAVLHRGGQGAFLNAYSWVWDNVIEAHTSAAGVPFLGCPDTDPTRFTPLAKPWIGCVWELPPLAHERTAWVRHMLAPDQPDIDAYLADYLTEGKVGW